MSVSWSIMSWDFNTTILIKLYLSNHATATYALMGHEVLQCRVSKLELLARRHCIWSISAQDHRDTDNIALLNAARNGHVQCLEFLWTKVGLTIDDFRAWDNWALRYTAENDRISVEEFLRTKVGLTIYDCRA